MAIRTREDAQRVLRAVPDVKRFYCHNGDILNNIYELKDALDRMDSPTFQHHVTEEKNDFARWVREVLGDDKLAGDLSRCSEAGEASRVTSERIAWLQERS